MKNKPLGIIIVQAMMLVKLIILFLLLILAIVAIFIGGDLVKSVTDYLQLTGFAFSIVIKFINKKIIVPAALIVVNLILINKRIYKAVIALLVIELLLSVPSLFPSIWVAIQILILIINKNAKKYFISN